VLDIMEPLRPVVDRAVLDFVWAKKSFHPEDFTLSGEVWSHARRSGSSEPRRQIKWRNAVAAA
jgi:CRISPR/Cas system-associated endonuclease Cas1